MYPNPGRHVEPFGNNLYDLGSPSFRWRNIYLNNSPAVTSDRRIKKNIIPISYGLQSILALNPVQYNLIDSSDSTLKLGLIAQDVKLIIPEIVDIEKRNSIYSDDSRSSTYSLIHDMQSIRYSDLIPVLIKAIQELEEKVKILEVKIKN